MKGKSSKSDKKKEGKYLQVEEDKDDDDSGDGEQEDEGDRGNGDDYQKVVRINKMMVQMNTAVIDLNEEDEEGNGDERR